MPDGRDTLAKFYTHTLPTVTPKLTSARTKVITRQLTSQLTYLMLWQVTFISHGENFQWQKYHSYSLHKTNLKLIHLHRCPFEAKTNVATLQDHHNVIFHEHTHTHYTQKHTPMGVKNSLNTQTGVKLPYFMWKHLSIIMTYKKRHTTKITHTTAPIM